MSKLGDFDFLKTILSKKEYKHLFDEAKIKSKEGKLIPSNDLFYFLRKVNQDNFKKVLYVPFITEGFSLLLKELNGKSIEDYYKEGILVIPRYLTYEKDNEKLIFHKNWVSLMDEVIEFFIKNNVEVIAFVSLKEVTEHIKGLNYVDAFFSFYVL